MQHPEARAGYRLFWGQWPSNWHLSDMVIDGITYNCVEQYMMAEKARLFGDHVIEAEIMATKHPADQKILGRDVRGYVDAKWAAVRYEVVLNGTLAKYRQNEELRGYLLATGDDLFVEASPDDRIWGIGMGSKDPRCTHPSRWLGTNLLGQAITEARDIIRAEGY